MPIDDAGNDAKAQFSASEPGQPVCACGTAPFDPSYVTSTVPTDLQPDPGGVYGYIPKPGTEFAKPGWPDWTEKEAVANARLVRVAYHQGLEDEKSWVADMRAKGNSDDTIARELVDMRNQARLSKYTEDKLPMIYERNQAKYQNKYGPTYESLLKTYRTPAAVISAGTRSNVGMDVLCGVATVVPNAKL